MYKPDLKTQTTLSDAQKPTAFNTDSHKDLDTSVLRNPLNRTSSVSTDRAENLGVDRLNPSSSTQSQSSENPTQNAFFEQLQNKNIVQGTGGNDVLKGRSSNDTLFGLAGNDKLIGNAGDDLLNGGTGRDFIKGGLGNDRLVDIDGGDILTGGAGADQFWIEAWQSSETPSTIADFEVGKDQIRIQRLGATFEGLEIQNTDRGTIVSDQGTAIAVLPGIEAKTLTPNSFIFGDAALAQQLQTSLDNSVKQTGVPGATNAIVTPDGFTWQGAAGVSNLNSQTPMKPNDLTKIGSIHKSVTAATVLKVVEEGKLSLDNTLGQWLPEIAQRIPDSKDVTLSQILNGTSGIYDYLNNPQFFADAEADYLAGSIRDWQPSDLVSYAYDQPRFSGTSSSPIWTYPQTGNVLAGLIVEKATGKPFEQVTREEVLDPLGMKNTFFSPEEPIKGNLARGYTDYFKADGTVGADGVPDDFTTLNNNLGWGSGSLVSTAQDIAQFSQGLFEGQLLSSQSLKEMLTFVDEGIPFEGDQYGLGIAKYSTNFGQAWGKAGSVIGYRSAWNYLPEKNGATSVVLTNKNNGFPTPDEAVGSIINSSLDTLL